MKHPGKPDTGNPSVRFDEGSESDGHWPTPLTPSAPAYSTPELEPCRIREREVAGANESVARMAAGGLSLARFGRPGSVAIAQLAVSRRDRRTGRQAPEERHVYST